LFVRSAEREQIDEKAGIAHGTQKVYLDLSVLEQTKNVICIAHGKEKLDPIISAARQHYIKVLITDEATAQALIQKLH